MPMAGRQAPGEAQEMATMADNADKQEEDRAEELSKFVKMLNSRKVAAQRRRFSCCRGSEG